MAKKAGSVVDGTPIQIKRTSLNIEDTTATTGGRAKINNDGPLKYGEPLYIDNTDPTRSGTPNYLIIGSEAATGESPSATSDLQVFSSETRSLSPAKLFFQTADGDDTNRVSLRKDDGTSSGSPVFVKVRAFTTRDTDGRSVDFATPTPNFVKVTVGDPSVKWYKVDSFGNVSTTEEATSPTDYPRAQRITVYGMTSNVVPYIDLSLTNEQLGSSSMTDSAKQDYGYITAVASASNQIVVYCASKMPSQNLYLSVFGG